MARDKKIPMTVHLPADLVAELKAEQFGDPFSQVVTDRLRQAFKMGPREASPASAMDKLDERKKVAEVEMVERRAAIMRGEWLRRSLVFKMVGERFQYIRAKVKQIPLQIQSLTPEQMSDANKAVEDCFTDLSGGKHADWDDVAAEAIRNPP